MEKKYIIGFGIGILVVIGVFGFLVFNPPLKVIKEIEVCEGVTIVTANANSDLCFSGCIQYKGQWVPYNTLKYLQEEICKLEDKKETNKSS